MILFRFLCHDVSPDVEHSRLVCLVPGCPYKGILQRYWQALQGSWFRVHADGARSPWRRLEPSGSSSLGPLGPACRGCTGRGAVVGVLANCAAHVNHAPQGERAQFSNDSSVVPRRAEAGMGGGRGGPLPVRPNSSTSTKTHGRFCCSL